MRCPECGSEELEIDLWFMVGALLPIKPDNTVELPEDTPLVTEQIEQAGHAFCCECGHQQIITQYRPVDNRHIRVEASDG